MQIKAKSKKTIFIFVIIQLFMLTNYVNAYSKFNMSYVYFGSPSQYQQYISKAGDSIKHIAPSYFNIDENGNLEIDESLDKDFISAMHYKNIWVTPFLSNHWNREAGRKALARREELAREIAEAVKRYRLDGVNVDIENLKETDRDNYTDFIRLLREELGSGVSLSIAVAPNPYGSTKGWQGSYDYRELAGYCDYLMIMAYDESYNGSPAGPVASYGFVEDSIKYALSVVPADKLVLGLPFYGRYWMQGEERGGYGIGSVYVEKLVEQFEGKVIFDEEYKSPRAQITIPQSANNSSIGYKSLKPGFYTIWYENSTSIKYKLSLAYKYNLKGTGSWSLGHEPEGTWEYYDDWLNTFNYIDADVHWAENAILKAREQDWMMGAGNLKFLPGKPATRAETAATLVRVLGLSEDGSNKNYFSDIEGHWAESAINAAYQNKIVKGMGNGMFNPDDFITREQMAVMLDRLFELKPGVERDFLVDLDAAREWSYGSIIRALNAGVFQGYPDNTFRPYDEATRAQLASILDRLSNTGYIEAN